MHVLFLMNAPNVRLLRQAIALHKTERHQLTLLYSTRLPLKRYLHRLALGLFDKRIYRNERSDVHLWQGLFDAIYGYQNLKDLREKIHAIDVDIIHAHAEPNIDAQVAMETASVPIVFDPTDITSMRFQHYETENAELEAERYCFMHASGYIHKGPEIEYVRQTYGFDRPTLHFDNYCLDEWIVQNPLPKLSQHNGEWHLAFAGAIAPLYFSAKNWGYKQYGGLADTLKDQQIHLHLYVAPNQSNALISYRRIAARNPYLHLHQTVPPHQISKEISQYDFGLWIHPRTDNSRIRDWMWRTAIGNKFYTYLESGIPLLVNDDIQYGSSRVEQLGVGLVVKIHELDHLKEMLDTADIHRLQENVRSARQTLMMSSEINRLEAFYDEVLGNQDLGRI